MEFIINETGEVKELHIYMRQEGIDWTEDLMGSHIHFDDEAGVYRISESDYNWWADYIDKAQADQEELDSLRSEYGADAVDAIFNREVYNQNFEYADQHDNMQDVFRVIREELGEQEKKFYVEIAYWGHSSTYVVSFNSRKERDEFIAYHDYKNLVYSTDPRTKHCRSYEEHIAALQRRK